MNRCKAPTRAALKTMLLAAALAPAALFLAAPAAAQTAPIPQTQNEAAAGGRNFPTGTLRGSFVVVNWPEIQLDGKDERLSPGSHIYGANRMLVMPASITGQNLMVNYTRDAAGMVRDIWILTPDEAGAERASAHKPLLNFWPFN